VTAVRWILAAFFAASACAAVAGATPVALSDEFDDAGTLASWHVIQGDLQDGVAARYDIASSNPGQLTVVPGRSWWVHSSRAFFVYKLVRGDFKATALVNATGKDALLPTANWSLSGILVRSPASGRGSENWVSFRTGAVQGAPTLERKSTRQSRSELVLDPGRQGWIELRIVRLGPKFFLLRRYPGGSWRLHWVYSRFGLPARLQVGIDAFSGFEDTHADLVSHVDCFRFAATAVSPKLKARYLAGRLRVRALLPYLRR
jgi:hypothetical protein